MFILIKQVFIAPLSFSGSLTSMANASNFTTYISLNNQQFMTKPSAIDLNQYNQGLRYYPFMINLHGCNRSCNILMIHLVEFMFHIKQKT